MTLRLIFTVLLCLGCFKVVDDRLLQGARVTYASLKQALTALLIDDRLAYQKSIAKTSVHTTLNALIVSPTANQYPLVLNPINYAFCKRNDLSTYGLGVFREFSHIVCVSFFVILPRKGLGQLGKMHYESHTTLIKNLKHRIITFNNLSK